MCGICGFINEKKEKEATIKNMAKAIQHRGPDSDGFHIDDLCALGFRRLSIIDLHSGDQPIYNEDGTKVITFNGEIYNYLTLREELIEKGHIFKTHADTEVLLHGYEEWGIELLQKIRGMYAFVIWDTVKKELFGARDHFGIKPFYYAEMNGTFMYASEIKALLQHPDFNKELNKEALKPYLTFQFSALDETFFKGVYRLKEGHYFTYKDGKMDIHEYYDTRFDEKPGSEEAYIKEIDQTIVDSIKAHEIADVKVGAFLSSGVDSSYVTAVSKPHYTFSVGFDDQYNEAKEAKKLTDQLGLQNTSRVVKGDESFGYFPLIQYHLDEPDANPSCVPLYFLSKLARQEVTVVLSGEGADELFGGYTSYGQFTKSKVVRVVAEGLHKLPKGIKLKLSRSLSKAKEFHGRTQLWAAVTDPQTYFIGQSKVFEEDQAANLLKPTYQKSTPVKEILAPTWKKVEGQSDLRRMQYIDLHHFMAKDILLKADKLAMANSIELRVPLLDKEVMAVAKTVPSHYLLNAHDTKDIYRKAAGLHLPKESAERVKLGFPVPIKTWLREERYYNVVKRLFEEEFVQEFFDQQALLQMLEDNYHEKIDARRKIWTVYTFLTWYKIYFIEDGKVPAYQEIA